MRPEEILGRNDDLPVVVVDDGAVGHVRHVVGVEPLADLPFGVVPDDGLDVTSWISIDAFRLCARRT
jgi:hypothetical protein